MNEGMKVATVTVEDIVNEVLFSLIRPQGSLEKPTIVLGLDGAIENVLGAEQQLVRVIGRVATFVE